MLRESAKRRNAVRPRLVRALRESLAEESECYSIIVESLQHLIPLALVLEHDLPEETNGRHAVAEQFVMEFLQ